MVNIVNSSKIVSKMEEVRAPFQNVKVLSSKIIQLEMPNADTRKEISMREFKSFKKLSRNKN